MTGSSAGYHEPIEALPVEVLDRHRAIASLMEEFEAVDWYEQRIAATSDPELAAILRHNSDEEREHAAMLLEWLRRRDPSFDGHLRSFLFTDGPITGREAHGSSGNGEGEAEHAAVPAGTAIVGDLGIGKIRSEQ
jgi:ferritin-like protein